MKKPTTDPAGVVESRVVPDQRKRKRSQSQRRKERGLARLNLYYASAKFAERQCKAGARAEEERVTGCGVVRGRDGESWKDSVCPPCVADCRVVTCAATTAPDCFDERVPECQCIAEGLDDAGPPDILPSEYTQDFDEAAVTPSDFASCRVRDVVYHDNDKDPESEAASAVSPDSADVQDREAETVSPFEKAVAAEIGRVAEQLRDGPQIPRSIPQRVGCRNGQDLKKIRMSVLRSRIGDAIYIFEDKYGDMVPTVQEARPSVVPVAAGAAPRPSGKRATGVQNVRCVHRRNLSDCEICRAARRGQVLKFTLKKHAFEVMVTGEKRVEFRELEEYNGYGAFVRPKPQNRSKLFAAVRQRGLVTGHHYKRPNTYEFVTFYNAGCFDSNAPNFTCRFLSTVLLPRHKTVRYSNGLVLRFNHRVAVVRLGEIVHRSPGL